MCQQERYRFNFRIDMNSPTRNNIQNVCVHMARPVQWNKLNRIATMLCIDLSTRTKK